MKLVVGNFKMNLLNEDIDNYIKEISKYSFNNIVLCPSNIYLKDFIRNNLVVGSQDLSAFESGSYTGDVSASQLKSIGVKYALVGHSERRKYYNEKEVLLDKLKFAIKEDIIPIYCIGETKEEYENNQTLEVLKREIDFAFNEVNAKKVIIAYEPIWAIGTGLVPSNEEIYNTIDFIKNYFNDKYKTDIKVLYGGSANNQNIMELEKISNIDGYLVGGCSIKVNDFIEMIKIVNKK